VVRAGRVEVGDRLEVEPGQEALGAAVARFVERLGRR
jgi:hypothetical protein